jgi:ribonuclease PH
VDLNLVATARGGIVEIQGTAEGEAIPRHDMDAMVDLAQEGIGVLAGIQRETLQRCGVDASALMVSAGGA